MSQLIEWLLDDIAPIDVVSVQPAATDTKRMIDTVDLSEYPLVHLNPFVSPLVMMLEKVGGATHEPTAWEQIGEKLIEMHEIADRLHKAGK